MQVVVHLGNLELIDSSGVAAIVSLYKRAREYGGAVKINGIGAQPLTVFKVLRLDRVFSL